MSAAEWATAWAAAWAELPAIEKGRQADIPTKSGGKYSYKYADLADLIRTVQPILAKHGLAIAQSVEQAGNGVAVVTRIYHQAGHMEAFGPVVVPASGDARAIGSAITYARRYGLGAALGIATDEDVDGAPGEGDPYGSSWEQARPAPRPQQKPPPRVSPMVALSPEEETELTVQLEGYLDQDEWFMNGTTAEIEATARLVCELLVKLGWVAPSEPDLLHRLLGTFSTTDEDYMNDEKARPQPALHWGDLGTKAHMQRFCQRLVAFGKKQVNRG